jgi:hypothetical protein
MPCAGEPSVSGVRTSSGPHGEALYTIVVRTETVRFVDCFLSVSGRIHHSPSQSDPDIHSGGGRVHERSLFTTSAELLNWNYDSSTRGALVQSQAVSGTWLTLERSFAFATASLTVELDWSTLFMRVNKFLVAATLTAGMAINPAITYTGAYENTWEYDVFPRDGSYRKYASMRMFFGIVPVTFSVSGKFRAGVTLETEAWLQLNLGGLSSPSNTWSCSVAYDGSNVKSSVGKSFSFNTIKPSLVRCARFVTWEWCARESG